MNSEEALKKDDQVGEGEGGRPTPATLGCDP